MGDDDQRRPDQSHWGSHPGRIQEHLQVILVVPQRGRQCETKCQDDDHDDSHNDPRLPGDGASHALEDQEQDDGASTGDIRVYEN